MNRIRWRSEADARVQGNLEQARLDRYEKRILESKDWSSAFRHALVQGSQEADLQFSKSHKRDRVIASVSAKVAAPFLIDYTIWILRKAKEEKIERLYFLARDAQYVRDIAESIAPELKLDCELRYLQVSRISINLAAAGGLGGESESWLLSRIRRTTPLELGAKLHLNSDELRDALSAADLPNASLGEQLGERSATDLLDVLRRDSYHSIIRDRAKQAGDRAIPYLQQEGIFEPVRIGVVDLGGTGSQFRAIASFRRTEGLTDPIGFLVCRDSNPSLDSAVEADDRAGCERLHVYLTDDVRETGPKRFAALITLLEVFCAADHGRVVGYEERSGKWIPVTDGSFGASIEQWGLTVMRGSMDTVLSHVVGADLIRNVGRAPAKVVARNLRSFVVAPSREEAIVWGSFPSSDDVGPKLAEPVNFPGLISTFRHREVPIRLRRWWPASVKLSPLWIRVFIKVMRFLRQLRLRWPSKRSEKKSRSTPKFRP